MSGPVFYLLAPPLLTPEAGLAVASTCSEPVPLKSRSTLGPKIFFPPACLQCLALCYIRELAAFIFNVQEQELGLLLPGIEQGYGN